MNKINISPSIEKELPFLYELSMSIGNSLDIKENSRVFSKILIKHKRCTFISIWLTQNDGADYQLVYASNNRKVLEKSIDKKHFISKKLTKLNVFAYAAENVSFEKVIQEKDYKAATVAIVRLGNIGFIKLHSNNTKSTFLNSLNELENHFKRLALSLKASLTEQQIVVSSKKSLSKVSTENNTYQLVIKNMNNGIVIVNKEGEVLLINQKLTELTGYSEKEVIGKNFNTFLEKVDQAEELNLKIEKGFKGKKQQHSIQFIHKISKQKWWCSIQIMPFKDSDNRIDGVLGIISNISDQRATQRALIESENRFRKLYEDNSLGIAIIDDDRKTISPNKALCKLLGYSKRQIQERGISSILHPDDKKKSYKFIDKLFEKQAETLTINKRYIKKNGKIIHSELTALPLKNEEGNVQYIIAMLRDITEQVNANKILIENEERYRLLFEKTFDGLIIFDEKLNHPTFCNKKTLNYFKVSKKEFMNSSPLDFCPKYQENGQLSSVARKDIIKKIKKQRFYQYEWLHQRKDGVILSTEITTFTLPFPKEHLRISVFKDITERKIAEQQLKESEQALKESEAMMQAIFQSTKDKIYALDKNYNLIAFNKSFNKIKYLFNKKELSKGLNILPESEAKEEWKNHYDRAFTGETFTIRKSHSLGDKKYFDLVNISPIRDKERNIIGCSVYGKDITELMHTQRRLKESEEKFRSLYEQSPVGVVMTNENGQLIANQRFADMIGYSIDEIKKLDINDITFSKEEQNFQKYFKELNKGKIKSFNLPKRYIKKDKSIMWGNVTVSIIRDTLGDIQMSIAVVIDITEKKAAQAELERSQNRLKDAQRLAKMGNWEFDITTKEIFWSPETFNILGFDPKKGNPSFSKYISVIHPDDKEKLKEAVNTTIQTRKPYELEIRKIKPDGTIIHTIARGQAHHKNGKTIKIYGTVQDISLLKKKEIEIRETNERYRDLFENMYDSLLIINKDGTFKNANKAACKLLGYTEEELKQIRIPDIVHPDDKEKSNAYLQKLLTEGFYSNYEGRILTKDRNVKYLRVNSNAIYENDEFVGSRDIARDITELKDAEIKREQLLKELEDFAYIVSHDLKAPLRAIGSLSQFIAEDYKDLLDDQGKKHISLLQNRVTRMHNFIEGILEYSRIGRIYSEKESIDTHELIENINDLLDVPSKFSIKVPKKLPIIFAERIRIEQLFQNLISNAIKYNDKANGWVQISYKCLNKFHQFTVKDNGAGIEEKYFNKIFQIFQTLQPRDRFESTGIGLTIVKRIIENYEGQISVRSQKGKGTSFEFTIKK